MRMFISMRLGFALLILAGMIGIVWGSAVAQGQAGQSGQAAPKMMCRDRFDAMDVDHDGKVTKEEFMSMRHPGGRGEDVFKSRDKNDDGILTKEEFCAGKGAGGGMGKGGPR